MKSFKDFQSNKLEHLVLEMPHIPLEHGQPIDLELEVHSNMNPDDYIQYFKDWLEGKKMPSKNPGYTQKLSRQARSEFADAILNQWNYTRLFTIKYYGERVWKEIERILKKYL